eukprot:5721212-Pyramimonas_sp.AAC.1
MVFESTPRPLNPPLWASNPPPVCTLRVYRWVSHAAARSLHTRSGGRRAKRGAMMGACSHLRDGPLLLHLLSLQGLLRLHLRGGRMLGLRG